MFIDLIIKNCLNREQPHEKAKNYVFTLVAMDHDFRCVNWSCSIGNSNISYDPVLRILKFEFIVGQNAIGFQ